MSTFHGTVGIAKAAPDTRTHDDWRLAAACRDADPELFFDRHKEAEALTWCHKCPVRKECLADNLDQAVNGEHTGAAEWGVVGALTRQQRMPLIKAARQVAVEDGRRAARKPARCGTTAGKQAHYRRDEKPCAPCIEASREYDRMRNASGNRKRGTAA